MHSTEERESAHENEVVVLLRKSEALSYATKMSKPQVPSEIHGPLELRDKTKLPNIETNKLKNRGEYHHNHLT